MAEGQHFTVQDRETGNDNDRGQENESSSIARRSVSIFSRRGTADQDSKPSLTCLIHTSHPEMSPQHSWLGRMHSVRSESRPRDDTKVSHSKGTVLKAVPQAETIEKTLVEEEMTTSTNEEIPSAIGQAPSSLPHHHQSTGVSIPARARASLRPRRSGTLKLTRHSQRHSETEHRIGTWINGVAHFNHSALDYWAPRREYIIDSAPVSTTSRTENERKPHLSLDIPSGNGNEAKELTINRPDCAKPSSTGPVTVSTIPWAVPRPVELPAPVHATRLNITFGAQPSSHKSHLSQSSTSSQSRTDESSTYSRRSSITSVDTKTTVDCHPLRSASRFSVLPPTQAGVFDDESPQSNASNLVNFNKALPPTPAATPPPSTLVESASVIPPRWSKSLKIRSNRARVQKAPSHRSMTELRISPYTYVRDGAISPTLSQAEDELSSQLSSMGKQRSSWVLFNDQINEQDLLGNALNLKRRDSVREVMQPPLERAPELPKRSRKREWRASGKRDVKPQQDAIIHSLERRRSEAQLAISSNETITLPLRKTASISYGDGKPKKQLVLLPQLSSGNLPGAGPDIAELPGDDYWQYIDTESAGSDVPLTPVEYSIPSSSAEVVLLKILCSLGGLTDLFNMATINKGMYRVYKEHEMELIKSVIRNISAPAFELKEWKHPGVDDKMPFNTSPTVEHTPHSYVASYRRDLAVIQQLKKLIHEKCGTFIRRETTFALSAQTHPHAQRFDDALWRIWCFTFIFGSRKGREEDISNQLSWIQGDALHENEAQGCATIETSLDFDMSTSVLLFAPTHFGVANRGGLTAAQLYDITEMWTCLGSLLHGYSGRVSQARESGVFDKCDVVPGDIETEERLLEEWLAHILTLGPAVVLDMALWASDESASGFTLAKQNGWTNWRPPIYNASLRNFLKEPVATIYTEQIVASQRAFQDPHEHERKIMSRRRVASMAAEIRLRRQSSEYKRLPLIDMRSERPMSVMSRSSTRASSSSYSAATSSPASSQLYRSPTSHWSPPHSISPILEDRPEPLGVQKAYSTQKGHTSGLADNTSDFAVAQLMSMGFPASAARQALKLTDDGESLRVDRAVEYLLRQR